MICRPQRTRRRRTSRQQRHHPSILLNHPEDLGTSSIQITQFGTIYGTNTSPPNASVRVETGPHCGNSSCETGENTSNCCQDCGSTCGDGICSFSCEWGSCPYDCPVCGDGYCSPGETCFEDCGSECPPCIICPCNL